MCVCVCKCVCVCVCVFEQHLVLRTKSEGLCNGMCVGVKVYGS